jgi:hypothetical protein
MGNEGHQVIAFIAQALLSPIAKQRVTALLDADSDSLTAHDIASEATWVDKYREANINGSRDRTRQWHFVDIEIDHPDVDQACFNHPLLPPRRQASGGDPQDCVIDKIEEFSSELKTSATDPEEQVIALKDLLHFVGDLAQPLHASDDHDRGGNSKNVSANGFRSSNLHRFWDTEFVERLGRNPKDIATALMANITRSKRPLGHKEPRPIGQKTRSPSPVTTPTDSYLRRAITAATSSRMIMLQWRQRTSPCSFPKLESAWLSFSITYSHFKTDEPLYSGYPEFPVFRAHN